MSPRVAHRARLGADVTAAGRLRSASFGLIAGTVALSGCGPTPGYSEQRPTEITCGCHSAAGCYDQAAQLAKREGETAESGERLLYFAQCACFQGSMAGCNTLSHFAKDNATDCAAEREASDSCTISGFVYQHGVRVPNANGRSFDRDPATARKAFQTACNAGSQIACAELR